MKRKNFIITEIVRILKKCDDTELIDMVYLLLLKSTNRGLDDFNLFGGQSGNVGKQAQ